MSTGTVGASIVSCISLSDQPVLIRSPPSRAPESSHRLSFTCEVGLHLESPLESLGLENTMRFLHTTTGQFVDANPKDADYAILSHTWDRVTSEQTFQDLKRIQERYAAKAYRSVAPMSDPEIVHHDNIIREASIWDDPDLSPKIRDACAVARANGFRLIWIDSCCIDKASSAELSEAINSMYAWYAGADVCYAYLVDVPPQDDHWVEGSRFRRSVWFTRGWTLQELIAPFEVIFLSQDWNVIGSKRDLVDLVEEITTISADALLRETSLDEFSVARRLSWASKRQTTRVEDQAYSLLGIFDIYMPTLYGEGERAFRRLQEEIMQRIPDQSLFAACTNIYQGSEIDYATSTATPWRQQDPWFTCLHYPSADSTVLPPTPSEYQRAGSIVVVSHDDVCRRLQLSHLPTPEYTSTPHGIRTQLPVIPLCLYLPPNATDCLDDSSPSEWYLVILGCESVDHPGRLLGRVCHIPPSLSGTVEFLYSGSVTVILPEPSRNLLRVRNLFPLSSATIERCRPQIELKTVHIPNPERKDVALLAAVMRPHEGIRLILPRRVHKTLRARGYTAELRSPTDQDYRDLTGTHSFTLSTDSHVITVEYRHALTQYGNNLTIDGHVSVSPRPAAVLAEPSEEVSADTRITSVEWSDISPWTSSLRSHEVPVALSDARVITLQLGLNLVRKSYYSLDVHVLEDSSTNAIPATSEPGVEVAQGAVDVSSADTSLRDTLTEGSAPC
ncbi:HET-domain-containing protein [Ganoderma leucocontextum]|nr:HET-domain-containing protein [Ganoderma leucocontextum]